MQVSAYQLWADEKNSVQPSQFTVQASSATCFSRFPFFNTPFPHTPPHSYSHFPFLTLSFQFLIPTLSFPIPYLLILITLFLFCIIQLWPSYTHSHSVMPTPILPYSCSYSVIHPIPVLSYPHSTTPYPTCSFPFQLNARQCSLSRQYWQTLQYSCTSISGEAH